MHCNVRCGLENLGEERFIECEKIHIATSKLHMSHTIKKLYPGNII